jgi:hypothetical protein
MSHPDPACVIAARERAAHLQGVVFEFPRGRFRQGRCTEFTSRLEGRSSVLRPSAATKRSSP